MKLQIPRLTPSLSLFCVLVWICSSFSPSHAAAQDSVPVVVIVSANAEWRPFRALWPEAKIEQSPFGDWFAADIDVEGKAQRVVFVHGGWGKISAAASAQYAIDRWAPKLLVNLGTCGGFRGEAEAGDTILVEKTVVYDIVEKMGDSDEAIAFYSTQLDLSWLQPPYPTPVKRTGLVSADRDLLPEQVVELKNRYGAVAGDWESGAIAWVAARNRIRCLILRTVSDVVDRQGGEAYGNLALFEERTKSIMKNLSESLPLWIAKSRPK